VESNVTEPVAVGLVYSYLYYYLRVLISGTSYYAIFHAPTAPCRPWPPHYRDCRVTLRHTTLGRTPLEV
jgi:hypothetical protein